MRKKVTVQRFSYSPALGQAIKPFNVHWFEINRPHRFAKWRDVDGWLIEGMGIPIKDGEHTHEGRDIVTVYTVESV